MLDKIYKGFLIVGMVVSFGIVMQKSTATNALAAETAKRMESHEILEATMVATLDRAIKTLDRLDGELRDHEIQAATRQAQIDELRREVDRFRMGTGK